MNRHVSILIAAASMAAWIPHAGAHGDKHPGTAKKTLSTEQHAWGREGDPAKATRTIEVDMSDAMRFLPAELRVKRGETVRFAVRNTGKVMHEMVLGTREELERHAEMMRKHPGMEHDAPYMAHVAPGKTQVMAWTFDREGTFMYGCLIPGHWESGMKGSIVVSGIAGRLPR